MLLLIKRCFWFNIQGLVDVPIFGRISVLKLFRPRGERKDLLFILTERYKFCVLEYNEATGKGILWE